MKRLPDLSWNRSIPDVGALRFAVPRSIVESIEGLDCSGFRGSHPEPAFEPGESVSRAIAAWSSGYLDQLVASPGLVLFELPDNLTDEQLRAGYYLISRSFGALNDRYGYLFDVKDQGLDYTKQAVPVSKTRASTGFHTDSTAREYLPDIVGLLCIDPGYRGGESLVANAADLYDFIRSVEPRFIELLSQPLYRDVITPGTVNDVEAILKNRFPIFSLTGEGLTCRYMRFWIETAYQKTREEMPDGLMDAMDLIDRYLNDPENQLVFQLGRGDIFYVNNRFLCHSRTAFEDAPEHGKIRLLVRTWVNLPARSMRAS
jgi:alpha-ketoglutarate-dependent taurine dioxygenase